MAVVEYKLVAVLAPLVVLVVELVLLVVALLGQTELVALGQLMDDLLEQN